MVINNSEYTNGYMYKTANRKLNNKIKEIKRSFIKLHEYELKLQEAKKDILNNLHNPEIIKTHIRSFNLYLNILHEKYMHIMQCCMIIYFKKN